MIHGSSLLPWNQAPTVGESDDRSLDKLRPYSALLSTTDRVPNLKQADLSLPMVQLGEQSTAAMVK